MKFFVGVVVGICLALGLGYYFYFSPGKMVAYPREVSKPTEIKEIEALSIPYSGYTSFYHDPYVTFLDLDKVERLGEADFKYWTVSSKEGKMVIEKKGSGSINTHMGVNDVIDAGEGFQIEFIDSNLIKWTRGNTYFYSEDLPEFIPID